MFIYQESCFHYILKEGIQMPYVQGNDRAGFLHYIRNIPLNNYSRIDVHLTKNILLELISIQPKNTTSLITMKRIP